MLEGSGTALFSVRSHHDVVQREMKATVDSSRVIGWVFLLELCCMQRPAQKGADHRGSV